MKLMRTRPCRCGSGRAARDCCGLFRRVPDAEIARGHLRRQARAARDLLAPFSPSAIDELRREAADLVDSHPGMVAAAARCSDTVKLMAARRPLDRARRHVDLSLTRVALARQVMALREDGLVDDHLAAAALVDLEDPSSVVLTATVDHLAAALH